MSLPRHRSGPLAALAVLAAWPLLAAAPAAADPAAVAAQRAEVDRLSGRLAVLDGGLERAELRLADSRERLRVVVRRMRQNRLVLMRVTRDLDRSRGVLADRLDDLYRRPEPSLADVLMQAGGIAGAVEDLGAIERAGRLDAEVVVQIRVTRATVVMLRRQLARDRVQARVESARADRRRDEVAGLAARQREVLAGAEADLRRLVAEERERLRREAERRRREAEARRRAQAEARRQQELAGRRQAGSSGQAWSPSGTASWTPPASSPGTAYPLAAAGDVVGTPYTGTHTLGNWQSDRALDIVVAYGTPVLAVESGTVTQTGGGGGGRFAGLNLHLHGSGDTYFYAHLSSLSVSAGQSVTRGQVIGLSGEAAGVAHLHIARESGDPMALASGG